MQADDIGGHITSLKAASDVKVKICGIRDLAAAQAAIAAGADFLGFNFVLGSRRYIRPENAANIIDQVRGKVGIVGVFCDAPLETVQQLAETLQLDAVQLHGDESPEYVSALKVPVIKAIAVPEAADAQTLIDNMQPYGKNVRFLLDRATQGVGKPVSLTIARELASQFPCFVAGGLAQDTVANVVAAVTPYGVDVAGGVERSGQTDTVLVRSFIKQARRRTS
jgi:phosphoribosylanthranilate isomerase